MFECRLSLQSDSVAELQASTLTTVPAPALTAQWFWVAGEGGRVLFLLQPQLDGIYVTQQANMTVKIKNDFSDFHLALWPL